MKVQVDHTNIQRYLKYAYQDPNINLFIIGDYEQFAFKNENVKYYLFYQQQKISAIALTYYSNLIIYSKDNQFDQQEMVSFIKDVNPSVVQGSFDTLHIIYHLIQNEYPNFAEKYFCEYQNEIPYQSKYKIKKATIDDVEKIYQLSSLTFGENESYIVATKEKLLLNACRIYYIEEDGNIVSSAETGIEASTGAMISNVATLKEYRGKGYASSIINQLCSDLWQEGKGSCLFYDNEIAGKMYLKAGFVHTNKWVMMEKGDE